tara:strand:+ start:61580 stop:62248 length:669 start_codon:yes stop_codon:yes gene_type:complete
MNKVFNIWILIITISTYPVAIAVGKNLDFSLFGLTIQGEEFEYKELFFSISAGLLFLFGVIRSSKKWLGLRVVKQVERFQFSTPISTKRKQRVRLYNILEIAFYLIFAGGLIYFSEFAIYPALIFVILALDNLINTILGLAKKQYRIGMTKKAIVMADRETKAVYFKGLKKISHHQQTMYFEYVNGLVLHFPDDLIPKDKWDNFVETLKDNVSPEKVYYSNL